MKFLKNPGKTMKYDITPKRLLEIGKSKILKHFLSIDIESAEILDELPSRKNSMIFLTTGQDLRKNTGCL